MKSTQIFLILPEKSSAPNNKELTDEVINDRRERAILDQQDFVDNTVHDLIETLLGRKMEWDIHITGNVRDAIAQTLEFHGLIKEDELYPYLEISEEESMADENAPSFSQAMAEYRRAPFKTILQFLAIAFVLTLIFVIFGWLSLVFG